VVVGLEQDAGRLQTAPYGHTHSLFEVADDWTVTEANARLVEASTARIVNFIVDD